MQIVIDIDENLYTRLFDNGDEYVADMRRACVAIRKGTPLSDILGQIRAEIKEWYWKADKQALAKDLCIVDSMIDLFIRTINAHMIEPQESEE